MTIAKTFLSTLVSISNSELSPREKSDKAWEELSKYETKEEDTGSGSTSEYIYTFADGSQARYVSYDEGNWCDIMWTPTDKDECDMTEDEYCDLCSNFAEEYGNYDEDEEEEIRLSEEEFLSKYPIERMKLVNELAEKHGIKNFLVHTDDDRFYSYENDLYYDDDELWDLYSGGELK